MNQPKRLGEAIASLAMPSVENCTMPCCKPVERTTFKDRYAQWVARHGIDAPLPAADESPRLGEDGLPWCANCGGYRWVKRDVALDHPDFGMAFRCQKCPPDARSAQRSQLAQHAGLSGDQVAKTFETFQRRRGTEDALAAARTWAEHPDGWLVIHGTPNPRGENRLGQGKTHLSCAVTNALIDRLIAVGWWYAPDLVTAVQRGIPTNDNQAILDRLQRTAVLVLDDLGAARATEFAIQQVIEPLLNYRERHRLPTLITCIADPQGIRELVSESIGRRFQDPSLCRVVAITAEQYVPAGAAASTRSDLPWG